MRESEDTAARQHDDESPARRRESSHRDDLAHESIAARIAWRISDSTLWAVLLVIPLMMGGSHPLGRLMYVALVGLMTVSWLSYVALSSRQGWRLSGAEPIIALGFLLLIVQLAPLSSGLLSTLSPGMNDLLPQWQAEGKEGIGLGTWSSVSLTPYATRQAFMIFTAHMLFFLVLLQRLRSLADVQTMLRRVAIVGTGMAVFALVQYCTSNGKFVWIYQHPSRETNSRVTGAFANTNHFAHYLALSVGPLLWCLVLALGKRTRSTQKKSGFSTSHTSSSHTSFDAEGLKLLWKNWEVFALAIGLGIAVLATLLSMSRGGMLALAISMFTCLGLMALYQMVSRRTLLALAATGLVACVAVFLHGADELQSEIDSITAGSIESLDSNRGRRKIWAADAQVAANFPVLGTGVGSHRDIYPTYFSDPETVEYLYAESGFMNLLVETGAAGMFVMVLAILLACYWGVSALWRPASPAHAACAAAVVGGILASVVHSIFDFVWYIPACVVLTLVLLACLCRLHQSASRGDSEPRQWNLPTWGWATGAVAMLLLATAMTWKMAPDVSAAKHWESYLSMSLATNRYDRRAFQGSARAEFGELDGNDEEVVTTMLNNLHETLKRNPNDGRAHLRMASLCLRRFETEQQQAVNAMALTHIRDAALASQFSSREALDTWLEAAIGENRRYLEMAEYHATKAVHLRPLQGRAYIQLAELSFLAGPDGAAKHRYIEQALAVRPYDGAVLFAAGSEAIMVGETEVGIEYWRKAFHAGPEYQSIIIKSVASRVPPDFFLATFEPDLQGLRLLFNHYRRAEMPEALEYIGPQLAQQLEARATELNDRSAAAYWFEAHSVQRQIGLFEAATHSGRQAVLLDGGDYEKRRTVAQWLYKREEFAEAAVHLRWCLHRRPDDTDLQRLLREAVKSNNPSSPSTLSQAILGDDDTTTQQR